MRWIKRLLAAILVLCALPIIALVILITMVDPNSLKPELQKQAAKHGVYLALDGDLSWQFFPNFGLGVEQLALLENEQAKQNPLASIDQASFSVAVKPLFSKHIQVNGIEVSGVDVSYLVAKDGSSNWDALLNSSESDTTEAESAQEPSNTAAPSIEINRIAFNALNFQYSDAQSGSAFAAKNASINIDAFNLNGQAFPLKLAADIEASDLPNFHVELSASSALKLDSSSLNLKDLALELSSGSEAELALKSDINLNWESMQGDVSVDLSSSSLRAWIDLFAPGTAEGMHERALTKLALKSDIKLNGDQYSLSALELDFDDTRLEGKADIDLASVPNIKANFKGDSINLDYYLPPTPEEEVVEEVSAEDTPLPLEALREFNADFEFGFGEVIAKNVEVKNLLTQATAKRGLIDLKTLQADIDRGSIKAKGQFDARANSAKLNADVVAKDLNLQYLLKQVADFDQLSGNLGGDIRLQSSGASSMALSKNLQAAASFQSQEVKLVPVNLVKSFCEAGAFIEGKQLAKKDWAEFTEFSPISLKAGLANEVAILQSFDASIEKFAAQASGEFDIAKGSFNFPISLKLADFASKLEGCDFISEKWRKQALPLRCKGTLDSVGAGTCLPDMALLREKLKQNVKREVEKEKDKIEEKAGEKAEELLDKHLKEEDKKKLKDLLKGLR